MNDRGLRLVFAFHWLLFQRLDGRHQRRAKPALPAASSLTERFTFELWEKV